MPVSHRKAGEPKAAPAARSLAKRINAAHEACEDAARRAIEHAFRAGDLLREAKAAVSHGEWLPWVHEHLTCSARTAQGYMRLSENRARLPNAQRAAHLSVREALHLLADPRPAIEEGPEFDPALLDQWGPFASLISSYCAGSPERLAAMSKVRLSSIGAEVVGDLTFEEWKKVMQFLLRVRSVVSDD